MPYRRYLWNTTLEPFLKIQKIGPDFTLFVLTENKIFDSAVHYKNSSAVSKTEPFLWDIVRSPKTSKAKNIERSYKEK